LALTNREKDILRLKKIKNLSDYQIARQLKVDIPSVIRSRKNALKKIDSAKADLKFLQDLEDTK
jgi:DNA-binding CsgD family transcriptional regulator